MGIVCVAWRAASTWVEECEYDVDWHAGEGGGFVRFRE
jgi:hypothetical protein